MRVALSQGRGTRDLAGQSMADRGIAVNPRPGLHSDLVANF